MACKKCQERRKAMRRMARNVMVVATGKKRRADARKGTTAMQDDSLSSTKH